MPLRVVDLREAAGVPDELAARRAAWDAEAAAAARRIVEDVRRRGDEAVREHTERLDGVRVDGLRVPPGALEAAVARCDPDLLRALQAAARNVRDFHEAQRPADWTLRREGVEVGRVYRPIRRVGIYVPGGRAPLASTVIMTAVPARVAGVPEVALCSPPQPGGLPHDAILAAAAVAGVSEVYRVGGAQAVAAMAFGTESIPPCDKVVGPGNAYVTAAKREVFGVVGIDGLFGPSESGVVADGGADAALVALELATQAEHAPDASAVLVTTDPGLLRAAAAELERWAAGGVVRAALGSGGLAILVRDLEQAAEVVNALAFEHLCLFVEDPDAFLPRVRAAGTVLVGPASAAALSDYCAGPSHVLPTGRTARFSSGLSVADFMVGINVVRYGPEGLAREGPVAAALAAAEGLAIHRAAVEERLR